MILLFNKINILNQTVRWLVMTRDTSLPFNPQALMDMDFFTEVEPFS